jgi:hypothetical protein
MTDAEEAAIRRWSGRVALGFFVFILAVIPLVRSGFFRKQFQLKQARALIEKGGYAYCAIWGDGTDPFQLMPLNSPMHPSWSGQYKANGIYLMTFTYRRSGKVYEHRWSVDLPNKRVLPSDDENHVPLSSGDGGRMQCSE